MDSRSAKKLQAKPMKLLGYPRSLLLAVACRLLLCRPPSRPSHRLPCPPLFTPAAPRARVSGLGLEKLCMRGGTHKGQGDGY
jgi:hypothetical protein